jgi:hypothetical protein
MFLALPDPDPLVRGMDPDPDHHAKIVRKTLIPTILRLFLLHGGLDSTRQVTSTLIVTAGDSA